jgi:hypothetical protein
LYNCRSLLQTLYSTSAKIGVSASREQFDEQMLQPTRVVEGGGR